MYTRKGQNCRRCLEQQSSTIAKGLGIKGREHSRTSPNKRNSGGKHHIGQEGNSNSSSKPKRTTKSYRNWWNYPRRDYDSRNCNYPLKRFGTMWKKIRNQWWFHVSMRQKIMEENHDVPIIEHVGVNKIVEYIKRAFW